VNWELWMNNAKENPNEFLEHVCKEKWVKIEVAAPRPSNLL
jgi:hypothetical protein